MLTTLGHAEVSYREGVIEASPPVLARVPQRGLPAYALAGFRTEPFLRRLRETAREEKCTVRGDTQSREWAPARILLTAPSAAAAESVAKTVGAICPKDPPAASLASVAPAITEYEKTLTWLGGNELDWPRRDFDPEQHRFTHQRITVEPRLSSYQDPVTAQLRHFIWKSGRHADTDRSLGRYLILAERRVSVLRYDREARILSVPAGCPLPSILAKAAALCSGRAPFIIYPREPAGHEGAGRLREAYTDVPLPIAQIIAKRLSQDLTKTTIPNERRE
jgi:hypothetical protein